MPISSFFDVYVLELLCFVTLTFRNYHVQWCYVKWHKRCVMLRFVAVPFYLHEDWRVFYNRRYGGLQMTVLLVGSMKELDQEAKASGRQWTCEDDLASSWIVQKIPTFSLMAWPPPSTFPPSPFFVPLHPFPSPPLPPSSPPLTRQSNSGTHHLSCD